MQKILVTGGTGFLGQHLVRALQQDGHALRILTRTTPGQATPAVPELETLAGDIRDSTLVDRAVSGVDVVIHTVSNFRRGGSDRREAFAINVEGTRNVCRAAARSGVRQLIHCSTIGVHGHVRQVPADEQAPFNPGDIYQSTKLQAEREVFEFARQGLPVTVVRPISMYGPGDRRMLKLFRLIKRRRFVMVGDGRALFQPAYIDDVVQGFRLCLNNERALGQAFIVGSEQYLPLHDLFRIIAEELHVAPPRARVPLGPVLALARLCETLCVPLGLEPPLHSRRVSFFRNNRAFSIDKAKRLLGFEPRMPLRAGIRRTIDWYGEQHWL